MRLWFTSNVHGQHLSPAVVTWQLSDTAYSLCTSLFRFSAWIYSESHLLKAASLLNNGNKTYGQHTEENPTSSSGFVRVGMALLE